ncbi:hypothetical protein BACCAP_02779 [Pseudoflavonifractor capillosus ATCC 29799]|uniref:Uncharacterized protein n=1 Tax=Pseudoflavonifractor capillosus ATCC 29799 TaxID=411467 RepID=A6NX34_9FIRM|nr:hypothetical protein BACCAP_02779 [Pseudoflavonifractor capillosus ATCC 29799]
MDKPEEGEKRRGFRWKMSKLCEKQNKAGRPHRAACRNT